MLARFKFWEISGVEKSTKIKRVRVERASKACFHSGEIIYHMSNLYQVYHRRRKNLSYVEFVSNLSCIFKLFFKDRLHSIHDEFDGWDRQMMGYLSNSSLSNSRDCISHSAQLQVMVYPS